MELTAFRVERFRNLADGTLSWHRASNLVLGDNGEGKTNLLEAITVLGTLRSFRTDSRRQLVRHGCCGYLVAGEVQSVHGTATLRHELTLGSPDRRRTWVDSREVSPAVYLSVFPVFALAGDHHDLVLGAPENRRSLLDRFAFLLDAHVIDEVRTYRRALRQRNAALSAAASDHELAAWSGVLAAAAARLVSRRRRAATDLREAFRHRYDLLRGPRFPDLELSYRTDSSAADAASEPELEQSYRQRYNDQRARDRQAGFTLEGPHRHDLSLRADGRPVRHVLSSGQTKVVAAALRLAALAVVESNRSERLPVIIDDVDAELDSAVLAHLMEGLGERQLFLSSPHGGEIIRGIGPAATYRVQAGTVEHDVSRR